MDEKKGVRAFLKKTFELKKKPEEEDNAVNKKMSDKPAAKTTDKTTSNPATKPAAKTTTKPAAKTTDKPAAKTTAKPAAKTTAKPAAKTAAKPAAKTAAKPAVKTTAKPASKTTAKTVSNVSSKTVPPKREGVAPSKKPVEFSKNMTKADNVRFYIYQNYFKPSKLAGQNKITLVAGDIHQDMGLRSEMPTVSSAMKTRIDRLYDVEILDIKPPGAANSKLTVKYDLRNLYMEEESAKSAADKQEKLKSEEKGKKAPATSLDAENNYMILKELEEKLRQFVSDRSAAKFGKEWWKGTDMSFLADRWKERRIMNDRTNAGKRSERNESLINYASFSDYRRIINNPFAWDAFEEYFPDRSWIIQRLKELDPIRNAIMHHTPLEEDDYIRLGLYSRDILKIIDKSAEKTESNKKPKPKTAESNQFAQNRQKQK